MQRMGFCIGLKAGAVEEYKRLHAEVWPGVLATLTAANIRNYSIFLREPENLLFAYWEYHGSDFAKDTAEMGRDPTTQKWWQVCDPLQAPLTTRGEKEWWARMAEIFHHD